MNEGTPTNSDESMPTIERLANGLEQTCADLLKNKYGNPKYNIYAVAGENGEEGRIVINSIIQYSPSGGNDPETGEFNPNLGTADFHYEGEGDHGGGELIFRRTEDGSLTYEMTGELDDQDVILSEIAKTQN